MYRIIFYTTARGESPVDKFLNSLGMKARTKIRAFIGVLRQEGHNLRRPYTDTVRGKIRELRIPYRTDQYRVLYFFFHGDSIVLLNGFTKKTQEIPEGEIKRAERYMRDFISRYGTGEIVP